LESDQNFLTMPVTLVFATHNQHKLQEVATKTGDRLLLQSLTDINCHDDIEENGTTFQANASIKSHYIFNKYQLNCFGDDSGLEIEALNNEPGVYSARYAGEHGNHEANMNKVLQNLEDVTNRKARFRTVISLLWNGQEHFFDGTVNGTIRTERAGTDGFGYDPIFEPEGYHITFAEMTMEEKNRISHRAIAMEKLIAFLKEVEG
jgi:XTP/dITP diphosphohydrolase